MREAAFVETERRDGVLFQPVLVDIRPSSYVVVSQSMFSCWPIQRFCAMLCTMHARRCVVTRALVGRARR
jgi:hypothetical protein